MAVKNFPNISPDANPSFTLESNTSSFESTLNKNVQHMELPGARWRGSVAFSNRTRQEANKIKAFMTSLGGQAGRFYLTPFDAYQSGTMSGAGVVDGAVTFGSSVISTKGWEGDQGALFEAGDYLEVNGELKMVTGDVAGVDYIEYIGTNYMPSPFDPSAWSGASDVDLSYTSVTEINPSGESFVGEFEYVGPSFPLLSTASYINSPVIGDYFFCVQIKSEDINTGLRIILRSIATTQIANIYINAITGNFTDGGYGVSTNNILTTNGTRILQIKIPYLGGESEIRTEFYFYEVDSSGNQAGFPVVGDKIKLQAAYFGKSDDWPANYLATADIPIAPPLRKSLVGGESITVVNPKGKFYLGSNDQSWDINVNGVQSMGFDFVEDVN
jgi:hypothetical protein